ncbi:MAG: ATP-binding protein [Phycisphaerales bacterium]|nr:ATP-binding protein [Phycisphaerales bacterium]
MAKRSAPAKPAKSDESPGPLTGAASRVVSLDGVIGHEQPKRTLASAMVGGRIHHAWIFHGPPGVGKFTLAYALASVLLDPTTGKGLTGPLAPDADSAVQRLCRAGTHPDLHTISKELAAVCREDSVRKSKQNTIAREVLVEFLLEPAAKTRVLPGESKMGKAFIVDQAELLDVRGQNTLLKTLEEPPAGTIIFLITSNEDRLLPTIRSRCQRLSFGALSDEDMDRWFKSRTFELDAKRRAWVRSFAAGSPGMAAMAVECELFAWHEATSPIFETLERGGFVPDAGTTLAKLVNERAEADVKANPDASKDGANKAWARRMLAFLAEHHRASLRARASDRGFAGADDPGVARDLAAIEAIQAAEGYLAANVNLALLFENLVAQFACKSELV